MRTRLFTALFILTVYLLTMGFVLIKNVQKLASFEAILLREIEIQEIINDLGTNIYRAQFYVYQRQSGEEFDNDRIISSITSFETDLAKLAELYQFNINVERQNCLHCHVAIDDNLGNMEQKIQDIDPLLTNYKQNISSLFTSLDAKRNEKIINDIKKFGNKIISEMNYIHHISNQMLNELDIETRKNYLAVNNQIILTLVLGIIISIAIIAYLIVYLTADIKRLVQQINLLAQNDFSEPLALEKTDQEMRPLVATFNKIIEELKSREFKLKENAKAINQANAYLERIKLTLEDKVRQRTKELDQTNKEIISHQLKLEATYSQLQDQTRELEEKNTRLMELDGMKSEFIQMANHEIRTPMVTIKGYTELLLGGRFGKLPEKALNCLRIMERSINRLTKVLENIQNYSLVEKKRWQPDFSEIDINGLFRDVYNDMRIITEKRNQNLRMELQPSYPKIICDRNQIYQVMVNLVINSIRYSPDQSDITISARYEKETQEIIFSVQDTGMGIEQKELKRVSLPFYEIKNIREHHSGTIEFNSAGTGLGLAIVKRIVENHNGHVWAESAGLWKGSTFSFSLPLKPNKSTT